MNFFYLQNLIPFQKFLYKILYLLGAGVFNPG